MPRARNRQAVGVFVPGQLSYLPKRRDGEAFSLSGSEIPDGCFDHPVLILSIDQRKREAVVLILTSFRGKSLDEHSSIIRAFHLPIHPSPVHPDNGVLLFLDHDLKLPKKTYVNTKVQHSIRWALLQADYRERKTGKRYRLRRDSLGKLLDYVGFEGQKKPKAPKIPRDVSINYPLGRELLEPTRANGIAGSINRPTTQPSRFTEPPRYSVRAPTAASTPQAIARSREGTAAEVDRYIAQRREARRHEARSILPTYTVTPRSDNVSDPDYSTSVLRKLFVVLLASTGVFLTIAWWKCQLSVCK